MLRNFLLFIGGAAPYIVPEWLLKDTFWDDAGNWDDTQTWLDE